MVQPPPWLPAQRHLPRLPRLPQAATVLTCGADRRMMRSHALHRPSFANVVFFESPVGVGTLQRTPRSKPPSATDNLLENTDGVLRPPRSLGVAAYDLLRPLLGSLCLSPHLTDSRATAAIRSLSIGLVLYSADTGPSAFLAFLDLTKVGPTVQTR